MKNRRKKLSYQYDAEVIRERYKTKGPGTFTLYRRDLATHKREVVGQWDVITGGSILDPKEYGGLTPPIHWVMIEPIASRQLDSRSYSMRLARLTPLGKEKDEYPNRTFYNLEVDPFMIHPAGTSTGCVCILEDQFDKAEIAINEAFANSSFIITVIDKI